MSQATNPKRNKLSPATNNPKRNKLSPATNLERNKLSPATNPERNYTSPATNPIIIAAAVVGVCAIVGAFFLFASPSTEESTSSTEESTSVDPCLSEGNFFPMDEQDGCLDPWPLTTTSGDLVCFDADRGIEVFWFTPSVADEESRYGVNDAALAWGDLDIDLIRKDAPEGSAELKVNLEPLLKLGLSLCENPQTLIVGE